LDLPEARQYPMKACMRIPCPALLGWLSLLPLAMVTVHATEPASVYEQPSLKSGTVYEAGSGTNRVLFHFRRSVERSNSLVLVTREFTSLDGKPVARERMVYKGNRLLTFELEELQIDGKASVNVRRSSPDREAGDIAFSYVTGVGTKARKKEGAESLRPDTLVNDMIAPFIATHWQDLMAGKTVKFRYIAAARAETVGFEFEKVAESTRDGQPVVSIKMSPSSYLIAALVDPLYFAVEQRSPHRVLEYSGRTVPKLQSGGKWRDLDALTLFHWD
jgi:hypothetical protein